MTLMTMMGREENTRLRANYNTMRCEIRCAYRINFGKPNSIGSLLGFSSKRCYGTNWTMELSINMMNVNVIRVKCNVVAGVYSNGKNAYRIYEFSLSVLPGYKISKRLAQIIYLPIIARNITNLIRVVDKTARFSRRRDHH